MKLENVLYKIGFIELFGIMSIIFFMFVLSPDQASQYRLYELFGALFGAILSTFGVHKMMELT